MTAPPRSWVRLHATPVRRSGQAAPSPQFQSEGKDGAGARLVPRLAGVVSARALRPRTAARREATASRGEEAIADLLDHGPSVRSSARGLGAQSARGRSVDRLMSVVPLDPISRRCLAKNLTYGAGAGGPLSRFRLRDDAVPDLENHRSSFVLPRIVPP